MEQSLSYHLLMHFPKHKVLLLIVVVHYLCWEMRPLYI